MPQKGESVFMTPLLAFQDQSGQRLDGSLSVAPRTKGPVLLQERGSACSRAHVPPERQVTAGAHPAAVLPEPEHPNTHRTPTPW